MIFNPPTNMYSVCMEAGIELHTVCFYAAGIAPHWGKQETWVVRQTKPTNRSSGNQQGTVHSCCWILWLLPNTVYVEDKSFINLRQTIPLIAVQQANSTRTELCQKLSAVLATHVALLLGLSQVLFLDSLYHQRIKMEEAWKQG